jgi:hypothetical protein
MATKKETCDHPCLLSVQLPALAMAWIPDQALAYCGMFMLGYIDWYRHCYSCTLLQLNNYVQCTGACLKTRACVNLRRHACSGPTTHARVMSTAPAALFSSDDSLTAEQQTYYHAM